MYLKSLELQGFKSFPDKIKLDFDKGLTAVVGPNGSGKSNIGDAVRWVLGEQSTKTLRGAKMEDVIFAGTQQRKAVGFAQVTLNIDNTDRALSVENDIVSVTRKLYRSGDSEYIINGKNVRLKDVVELFMDTGLGRDGYSIIGQGRVAEIVSSKSNERREIFEEAAGISKFRYRKEEALRKLIAAQDNILRLKDITTELEGRIEPLKQQSDKAEEFLILAGEKKSLEISVWMYKLDELKATLDELEDKYLIVSNEYDALDNEIENIDKEIGQAYSQMQQTTVKIENIRTEILDSEKNKSTVFADIAVLENDITHIKDMIKSIEENKQRALMSAEDAKNTISLKETELSDVINERNALASEEVEVTQKIENIVSINNSADKEYNELNTELNKLYITKSELNFAVTSGEKTIEDVASQITSIKVSQQDIDTKIKEYNKVFKDTQDALKNVDEVLCEFTNKISGYTKLLDKKKQTYELTKNKLSETDLAIREEKHKLQLLIDLENSMEGFNKSVKEVIRASKQGRIQGIKGSIAQLVKVKEKYSLAIETALGGALQNVVVENEEIAKRCIRFLKEQNSGRATFLPITSVKGNIINEKNLDMQEGFVEIASELIEYDSIYEGIIRYLLGRVVVAEDIDTATSMAKKYGFKFKIVTLDGQIINAGGSFTGGSSVRSTGMLTRRNEIEELKALLLKSEVDYKELGEKTSQLSAEVDKLTIDIEGEKQEYNNSLSDKIRFESELKSLEQMIAQAKHIAEDSNSQIISLEKKSLEAEQNVQISKAKLEDINLLISEKEEYIAQTKSKSMNNHALHEEYSNKLSQLKIRQTELVKDEDACRLVITQLKASIDNCADNVLSFDNDIVENTELISEKQKLIDTKKESIKNTEKNVDELNAKIKELQGTHQEFEKQANEKRNIEKIKNEQRENISREIAKVTERRVNVQKDYDNIISQLWEQYQMTKSQALQQSEKLENVLVAQKRLNELKNKIRALGNVNVAAIDEYKEVSERYKFMSSQLNDVITSKVQLEKLIDELTENMKTMFSKNFEIINENFKSIFIELFGGGKAELTLTDSTDVLESGIEINVAPPGKVIKNLSLLSGGEQAFVAIAIYFAILKLKPSPFCILDEIEAALDDVNVSKYAAYLRNFTDTTQFILITHRRGTMEESDVLYGVTMQEKGVSKLLKMDTRETVNIE